MRIRGHSGESRRGDKMRRQVKRKCEMRVWRSRGEERSIHRGEDSKMLPTDTAPSLCVCVGSGWGRGVTDCCNYFFFISL